MFIGIRDGEDNYDQPQRERANGLLGYMVNLRRYLGFWHSPVSWLVIFNQNGHFGHLSFVVNITMIFLCFWLRIERVLNPSAKSLDNNSSQLTFFFRVRVTQHALDVNVQKRRRLELNSTKSKFLTEELTVLSQNALAGSHPNCLVLKVGPWSRKVKKHFFPIGLVYSQMNAHSGLLYSLNKKICLGQVKADFPTRDSLDCVREYMYIRER